MSGSGTRHSLRAESLRGNKKDLFTNPLFTNDPAWRTAFGGPPQPVTPQKPVFTLDRTAKILALILLLTGAGLFVWASDRSFDFTDEGLYLLVYQHPHEFPDSYTSYHRVGAVVFQALGYNIVHLRLLGFFITALATWYFGWSLAGFLTGRGGSLLEKPGDRASLQIALQGSVLAAYSWLPPTPNYNTMAGIGMLLAAGGILAFFSTPDPRKSILKASTGLLAVAAGLLLAFLAKGSSAVGIVVVSVVLLGLCGLVGVREKLVFTGLAALLVLVGGLGVFLLMPDLFKSWEFLLGSIIALTEGSGANQLIERHWQESLDFLSRHVRFYALPIVLAGGIALLGRTGLLSKSPEKKSEAIFWWVVAVLAVEWIVSINRDAFVSGIRGRVNSLIGYSSLLVVLLLLRSGLAGLRQTIAPFGAAGFLVFLAWLAVLPFVTAAGTTHKIFINALLHAAPLTAAIVLLAASLDRSLRKPLVGPFAVLFLVGLGFAQFVSGFFVSPYRTVPKWTQTVPVEVGVPATVLKLDAASAACIDTTQAALRKAGFRPGDDVLALYGLPGLVYAVGGVSPQRPWFFNDHGPEGDVANLNALKKIPAERIRSAFVFRTDDDARSVSQLRECGVDFPEGFQKMADTRVPFKNRHVEIWKPRALDQP